MTKIDTTANYDTAQLVTQLEFTVAVERLLNTFGIPMTSCSGFTAEGRSIALTVLGDDKQTHTHTVGWDPLDPSNYRCDVEQCARLADVLIRHGRLCSTHYLEAAE